MAKAVLAVSSVLLWLVCLAAKAETATDMLSRCKEACDELPGRSSVTFEREKGDWRVASIVALPSKHARAGLAPLAKIADLEGIDLHFDMWKTLDGLEALGNLKHLRRLAAYTTITPAGLDAIVAIKELEDLDLSGCEGVTANSIEALTKLPKLRRLALRSVALDGQAMASIAHLANVEELDLTGAEVSDKGLVAVGGLARLRVLQLGRNDCITNAGLSALKGLKELRVLSLQDNRRITDAGLAELKGLTNLCDLDLCATSVVGTGLSVLKDLPHLERVAFGTRVHPFLGEHREVLVNAKVDLTGLSHVKDLDVGSVKLDNGGSIMVPPGVQKLRMPFDVAASLESQPVLRDLRFVAITHPAEVKVNLCASLAGVKEMELRWRQRELEALVNSPQLRVLTTWFGNKDRDCEDIGKLAHIEALKIEIDGKLSSRGLVAILGARNLRELKISQLGDLTVQDFAGLRELKHLRSLSLWFNRSETMLCVDGILAHLEDLDGIEELSLRGVVLTDVGLKHLGKLKKLRRLDILGIEGYSELGLGRLMDALPDLRVVKRSYEPVLQTKE